MSKVISLAAYKRDKDIENFRKRFEEDIEICAEEMLFDASTLEHARNTIKQLERYLAWYRRKNAQETRSKAKERGFSKRTKGQT